MKEDILEQLVDEYLQHNGYFTRHNIKFKPSSEHEHFVSRKDSVHSDIDVIGLNPKLDGAERVWVVSCKSRQDGFNGAQTIDDIQNKRVRSGREAWKLFRELTEPKWSDAFLKKIEEVTGEREFVYVTAVTKFNGEKSVWENHAPFSKSIRQNQIRVLTLKAMLDDLFPRLRVTPAASEIGRFLQLVKASQWQPPIAKRKGRRGSGSEL